MRDNHTKEAGMRGHVGAFQHLGKATKRADYALDDLKRCLRALVEAIRQAVWVFSHRARSARISTVHASHTSHTSHAAVHGPVTTIHGASHPAEPVVWRGVAIVSSHAAIRRGAILTARCVRRVI